MTAARTRGFTLLEMAVSMMLVAILVAAAVSLLTQQRRSLTTSSGDRAMQETARTALDELGTNLRRAGFGMEPWRAFDFGDSAANPMITYKCQAAAPCRESTAAYPKQGDQIVFHARDPAFKARLQAAPSAAVVTIKGGIQSPLYRGQILQLMCGAGSDTTYVTVGQKVAANWAPPAAAPVSTAIPLIAAAAGVVKFPQENAKLASGCYQTGWSAVRVYRIDRFRYAVEPWPDADLGGANRPYLMLDRGLEDDDAVTRSEPIAPDVEDLQFEYVFVNPLTGLSRVVGNVAGTPLANSAASIDLAAVPPAYDAIRDDPTRLTNHPANIRAVRVSVVVRTPSPDLARAATAVQLTGSQGAQLPAAGNRGVIAADPNYLRIRVETTEATRNTDVRAPYYED